MSRTRFLALAVVLAAVAAACGGGSKSTSETTTSSAESTTAPTTALPTTTTRPVNPMTKRPDLPGMPPLVDPTNIYAADKAGNFSPNTAGARTLVYVPNTLSGDLSVIDPATFKVIDRFKTGAVPQHVVPSYDLKTLWVNNNSGNTLTPIDPLTGKAGPSIPVEDPYNLYFTPDGRFAIVMEERNNTVTFRDASKPALDIVKEVKVPCDGVNHADFSPDGTYFIASCEFSGQLVKMDVAKQAVIGALTLSKAPSMPQDVRLTPDGTTYLVADMKAGGLWKIDGESFTVVGFVPTAKGAHGIYPSRDTSVMYVSNRDDGSISVIDSATKTVVRTWPIPGGGTPDMGGVSADGAVLWLSGRSSGVVYAIDVVNWKLLAKIPVGSGPHGLAVWPQPGRYSLGHTGNIR